MMAAFCLLHLMTSLPERDRERTSWPSLGPGDHHWLNHCGPGRAELMESDLCYAGSTFQKKGALSWETYNGACHPGAES